ncbi:MAG TPA: AraC family transcriptional regulator [Bacteroidetes bacterium]|nr:AraC family transcriptional regulator [Bacteroidota bacterium]
MAEKTIEKVPNKLSEDIFCIYTNYESDHTKPYTTLLGCKVADLKNIPPGMTGLSFNKSEYKCFTAKGNLMEGAVWNKWAEIWNADIDRAFTADFEIYGENAKDPKNAEVEIFVALK